MKDKYPWEWIKSGGFATFDTPGTWACIGQQLRQVLWIFIQLCNSIMIIINPLLLYCAYPSTTFF